MYVQEIRAFKPLKQTIDLKTTFTKPQPVMPKLETFTPTPAEPAESEADWPKLKHILDDDTCYDKNYELSTENDDGTCFPHLKVPTDQKYFEH
jgi:hypothetical protein